MAADLRIDRHLVTLRWASLVKRVHCCRVYEVSLEHKRDISCPVCPVIERFQLPDFRLVYTLNLVPLQLALICSMIYVSRFECPFKLWMFFTCYTLVQII